MCLSPIGFEKNWIPTPLRPSNLDLTFSRPKIRILIGTLMKTNFSKKIANDISWLEEYGGVFDFH